MTFRPDSPLNRLILLWPGVPVGGCALGFGLALYEVAQTQSGSFAALALAMGFGLAFSLGLLFHVFFIAWLEVELTEEGVALRPVGLAWLGTKPQTIPWSRVHAAQEVTRQGGHLRIATRGQVFKLERALFREETYYELCQALADRANETGLAAA